jgi:uncharacterized membrane protein
VVGSENILSEICTEVAALGPPPISVATRGRTSHDAAVCLIDDRSAPNGPPPASARIGNARLLRVGRLVGVEWTGMATQVRLAYGGCFVPSAAVPLTLVRRTHGTLVRPPRRPQTARRIRPSRITLALGSALGSAPVRVSALSVPLALRLPAAAAPWAVVAALVGAAALGMVAERTPVGAALSASLVTMFTTLMLANLGVLPVASPIYTAITTYLVPLAVPLLLFNADLRRTITQTGKLLIAFVVGALGSLVGTLAAWWLVPLGKALGPADAWKIAAALCARHIGGAVNYVAVAEATGASPGAITAGLAADNPVVAIHFLVLFLLARRVVYRPSQNAGSRGGETGSLLSAQNGAVDISQVQTAEATGEDISNSKPIRTIDVAVSVAVAIALTAVAITISSLFLPQLGSIPVVTAIVVLLATAAPELLRPLSSAASGVGIILMQVFFAATGASGSIAHVLTTAPALFLFSAVQIAVHLAVVILVGRVILRLKLEDLLLASNANVGGPTTAAGMAAAKHWDELIVPSLLIGVFGYAIATFLSLGLGHWILKPSILPVVQSIR